MKQYVGIIRDHSGSMSHLSEQARKDYNAQVEVLKSEAKAQGIDTIVSVVEVGKYPEGRYSRSFTRQRALEFRRDVVNSGVETLKTLSYYDTPGSSTPLFDATNDLIDILEGVPDKNDKGVAFLILVITDGEENAGGDGDALGKRIKALQGTDRWTFTFRVPFGNAYRLAQRLNIPRGNILEWEQTYQGFERATGQTVNSTQSYFTARSLGKTSVDTFYASPGAIPVSKLKRELKDITGEVLVFTTDKEDVIQPFVEKKTKAPYFPGSAFYQLVKTEKVQGYKRLVIRDRDTLKLYGGDDARELLQLPQVGEIRLKLGSLGKYDVFVQSNSVNRKLPAHTQVVVWKGVPR